MNDKLGISWNVKEKIIPINGLGLPPDEDTSGWFIWAGEKISEEPEFFVPLHAKHINKWSSLVNKYLGLAPGWRF